jgi:hypothetical protein
MADESQLSLLKQGAKAWNEWRQNQADAYRLRAVDLSGASLYGANLYGANLREANLREANLRGANLSFADLSSADLSFADLSFADLQQATLSEADLRHATLNGSMLIDGRLNQANAHSADLSSADLSFADLSRAVLTAANLWNAVLYEANFESATIGFTDFGHVDLSSCRGLNSVHHDGPSTLGIDSILHSKGRIPKIFLRGVGLPDEWIDYIPSLVGDGIQFFSCFISYSRADKPFADRLFVALQAKGKRCWLDEKQLLPGHDISRELERGIKSWDKFLLCASKNSLTSAWVEEEITKTLERERKLRSERGEKILKLIPLDLDGYLFSEQWDFGIHAREIRSRVAADFRDWENSSSNFDKQVDRVIRALRADEGAREKPPPSRL